MLEQLNWNKIHCGKITADEIQMYVKDKHWQAVRKMMKGASLETKFNMLENYLEACRNKRYAQVQVTNYINALKRGGMI